MFDLEELEKLRAIGARRVRYSDGAEVEFDVPMPWAAIGAQPKEEQALTGTSPIEQMPSRAELRAEMDKLAVASAEGAPLVTT